MEIMIDKLKVHSSPTFGTKKTAKSRKFSGFSLEELNQWQLSVAVKHKYKEPRLVHHNYDLDKRWWVVFYAYDEVKQAQARKRIFIHLNDVHTVRERLNIAQLIIDKLRADLRDGKTLNKIIEPASATELHRMKMLQVFEYVRNEKNDTRHRKTYTRGWQALSTNWKQWLLHRSDLKIDLDNVAAFSKIDITVKALKPQDVMDFFAYLNKVKRLENKTYNNYKASLSTVMRFIMKRDPKITRNPVEVIEKLPTIARKHRAFTDAQMEQITAACRAQGEAQMLLFIQFIYYLLCRPSEAIKIRVRYIDMEQRRILIPGAVSKTKFDDYIMMPSKLYQAITESGILEAPPDAFVFGFNGKPGLQAYATPDAFWKRNTRILEGLGLRDIDDNYSLYSYKHSGAISLYRATKDIALVQRQCRHRELSETSKYLRDLGIMDGFEGLNTWGGAA